MKRRLSQLVLFLMVLGWMAMIFGFSAQTGEASGGLSALISTPIAKMIASGRGMSEEAFEELFLQADTVVRKVAHFSEYAVLGGLLLLFLRALGRQRFWLSWLIGSVYAVLDEWHQAYSPGRACDVRDMLIDAAGVACGILMVAWINKLRRNHDVQD